MSSHRLGVGTQWTIAVAAAGSGTLATLLIANAVNHSGWSPWVVVVSWITVIAVATMLIKLRRTSLQGFDPRGANSWSRTAPGDGIHSGGASG